MAAIQSQRYACVLRRSKGHTHVVMELIKAGADVNQATASGATPLYIAAQKGHEVMWPCSSKPARTFAKLVKDGWTPMKVAAHSTKREKVATLLKFYERV